VYTHTYIHTKSCKAKLILMPNTQKKNQSHLLSCLDTMEEQVSDTVTTTTPFVEYTRKLMTDLLVELDQKERIQLMELTIYLNNREREGAAAVVTIKEWLKKQVVKHNP